MSAEELDEWRKMPAYDKVQGFTYRLVPLQDGPVVRPEVWILDRLVLVRESLTRSNMQIGNVVKWATKSFKKS